MNHDLKIIITIADGKVTMSQPEKVATVAPAKAKKAVATKRGSYVVGSKRKCLDILLARSHAISAARLAALLGTSVGAVHQHVYSLRADGWRIENVKGRRYKLA